MATKIQLRELEERISTTKKRLHTVIKYRIALRKDIHKIRKHIVKHTIRYLENYKKQVGFQKMSEYFRDEGQKLKDKVVRDAHTLDVLIEVIDHPYHLKLILQYFHELPVQVQKEYESSVRQIEEIFSLMRDRIEKQLKPNVQYQIQALEGFLKDDGIAYFIRFLEASHMGETLMNNLLTEIGARAKKVVHMTKLWLKETMKALHNPKSLISKWGNFVDDHKKAIAVIALALLLLDIAIPLLGGIQVAGFAIVYKVLRLGKNWTKEAVDIAGYEEDVRTLILSVPDHV